MAERRVTGAILALAVAFAVGGCAEPADPAPRPRSVRPDRGAASLPVTVVIGGSDFDASASTDFEGNGESTIDARFQALLGTVPLRDVRLQQDGTLTATVPEGIAVGTHELTVIGPDGQRGTLAAAYRALSDVDVAQLVATYRVEVGTVQEAYAPFDVTVTALDRAGATVPAFNGEVALTDLTGTAVPGTLARFQGGTWSGRVEVRAAHGADVLRVADALGNTGASAPFRVAPAPAAALRFATPPRGTIAGACSGAAQPVTLELLDAFGQPTTADGAVALLPTLPAGLSLHADAACTAPMAAPVIPAGSGSVTAWFRSTLAGAAVLDVAAAGITGATQVVTVAAAAPSRIAFVTAPRSAAAGACSPVATVEVRDAWDNAATGGAVAVELAASPAAGFALFADPLCAVPAASVATDAADARANLWFRGTAAQPVTITASGPGLAAASQVETVVAAAPHHLAFTTAPRTATAGACSGGVTLEARDAWENPATFATDALVALADDASGTFDLFAGSGCATPAAGAVTLAAGTSAITASFRATAAEAVTLGASAAGLVSASQLEQVVAAPAARLEFATAPQTLMAGSCSSADLLLRDAFGNAAEASAVTTVSLASTPASGFAFYADPSCEAGPAVVATTLAAGAGGATFWFRAVETGTFDVAATAPGLVGASQTETITPAVADRLVFATSSQAVAAGACSGAVTVRSMDPLGNVSALASGATVDLASTAAIGFTFHSAAGCGSAPVTSVAIPAAGSETTFFFRATVAEAVTVSVSAPGLTGASQTQTITPAAADRLVFSTGSQSVTAGLCSGAVTVRSMDPLGNVSPLPSGATIGLASTAAIGFTFHSAAGCGGAPVGSVAIPAAGSETTFFFRATVAEGVTVTATAAGLTPATQAETITPAAADRLVFGTSSQVITAGDCSGILTIEARDPFGNAVPASSAIPLDVSALPAAGIAFHADAACSIPLAAGEPAMIAGSSTASFHFVGTDDGTVTVTVAAGTLAPATQAETILAAEPDALFFTSAPQSVPAGSCSASTDLEVRDVHGNVAVAPAPIDVALSSSAPATFAFYGDPLCVTPISSTTIAAGASVAAFWFEGTAAVTVTVDVAAAGLTGASQVESIGPAEPERLVFTTPARTVVAGACSADVTLQSLDGFGNPSPALAATPVALSAGGAIGVTFFAGSGCGGAPVASVGLLAGASNVTFSFTATAAGPFTITATGGGLSPDPTQGETVTVAPPDRLEFTTLPQALTAGACSAVATVRSMDPYGNASPVAADVAVDLAAAPSTGFGFYSDVTCATPATTTTLAASAGSASFYFRGTVSGTVRVTASVAGWTAAAAQDETVEPGSATHFAWDPIATPQPADKPIAVRVTAQDGFGNLATGFAGTAELSLGWDEPLDPDPAVTCTSGCTGLTTSAFVGGAWSGVVTVSEPSSPASTTPDRWLVATSGASTGTSVAFAIVGVPVKSPPTAHLTYAPGAAQPGESVTFDASASTDYQTATADLEVSFDFTGTAPYPSAAWTPWTTVKQASHTFASKGEYPVRVAVRDADGDVGFASVTVIVMPSGTFPCRVDTSSLGSDGATSCFAGAAGFGADGKLSLTEALALSTNGTTIAFAPGLLPLKGSVELVVGVSVHLVGPGVVLDGPWLLINAGTAADPIEIRGLAFTHLANPVVVKNGHAALMQDVSFTDGAGISTEGYLTLERARFAGCSGVCVEALDDTNDDNLVVKYSEFRGTASDTAIRISDCKDAAEILTVRSSLFEGFDRAISISLACDGGTVIEHNTFEANGIGIAYSWLPSSGHSLRNNIFTSQRTAAATCGSAAFSSRDYHLLWQNASNGCVGGDPNSLAVDPLYLYAEQGDYRLAPGSPAIDAAVPLGLRLLPAFTASGPAFLGGGPDLGAFETW
jgi:hypothetical protein